jgi:rhodanese-related sulfurtransferase
MNIKHLLLVTIFTCTSGCQQNHIDLLSPEAFKTAINQSEKIQLIDVRTPSEYLEGHIAKAENFDWNNENFKIQIQTLDKSKPVMVYCQKGGRSHKAAAFLMSNGFEKVYELDGGYNQWKSKYE